MLPAYFWCHLYGNEFLLMTDHQPLKSLMESNKFTGKLTRWALMLMEYDFQVVHIMATIDEEGGEESSSAKDIFNDVVTLEENPNWSDVIMC
jgi:hypothetical protein